MISKILDGKPRVIGIDIFWDGVKDLGDDLKLMDVLERSNIDIILAVYPMETDNLLTNKVAKILPRYKLHNVHPANAKVISQDGLSISAIPFFDKDGKEYLPFPLAVVSKYLHTNYKLKFYAENKMAMMLGNKEIPLINGKNKAMCMLVDYIGSIDLFMVVPFEKVVAVTPAIFKNKIVLIGTIAKSIGDLHVTPLSNNTPGVVVYANAIHTIITKTVKH